MVQDVAAARPIQGLRVVETGGGVAVRYAGRLLASLGAEVRWCAPRAREAVSHGEAVAPAFEAWLDQDKTPGGELAQALDWLDAAPDKALAITGQDPSAVRALDAVLDARAGGSGVVRLGLTWYGDQGPYAGWIGHDGLIHALTGLAYGFGAAEGPPTLPQGHSPQILGGLTGVIGALAVLMAGESGPRRVDTDVLEAALCLTEVLVAGAAGAPEAPSMRFGVNRYYPVYPSTVYCTADGHVGVTALTPAQWQALCELVDRPDLAADARLATSGERMAHADEIDAVLAPLFLTRSDEEWVAAGARMRIPIAPATRPGALPALAHWRHRGAFAPVPGQAIEGPVSPYRFAFDGVRRPRPHGAGAKPLTGVTVADFTMGWAGPLATRYLADFGARVLKVESANRPDWWRGIDAVAPADPPPWELPLNFMAVNRGKLGLDLDLGTAEGRAAAERVIACADVVIDNQGPGVMEKLGLGPADQRRLSPGVISIAMPPFGRDGPLSGLRAYGTTVEHASGMPFVNGEAHWTPAMQHYGYGDPVAGLYAVAAALAALWGRGRLGGADVEMCQVECLFQLNADAILADQLAPVARIGNRRPAAAPSCVVPGVGTEAWLAVICQDDAAWTALCALLRQPSLAAGWPLAERQARAETIEGAIGRWAATHPPAEAAARLQAAGIAAAPVLPCQGLWRDPHLAAAGYWTTLQRRYVGEHLVPTAPMRFDGARPALSGPAPVLGEHTQMALAAL